MITVLSFCKTDAWLAEKVLRWAIQLDGKTEVEGLLSYEAGPFSTFDDFGVEKRFVELASGYFSKLRVLKYDQWDGDRRWPIPQNYAFQTAARFISKLNQPWFWWEPDLIPIKKDWLTSLEAEYKLAGKPFMGAAINLHGGYMAGCGVYPADVGVYSSKMMLCHEDPWDLAGGSDIYHGHLHDASSLIQHEPQERNDIRAFTADSLDQINPTSVCFHPCKDGSLIDVLSADRGKSNGFWNRIRTKTPQKETRPIVTINRRGAIGDVIMASVVANKLHEKGFSPVICCEKPCAISFENHPFIKTSKASLNGPNIYLDGAYEKWSAPEIRESFLPNVFHDAALKQTPLIGPEVTNLTPSLFLNDEEKSFGKTILSKFSSPTVAVCPKSGYWPNRTVDRRVWSELPNLAPHINWLWTGLDESPEGYQNVRNKDLRKFMSVLWASDMVLSVDTGSIHLAAALGKPIVGISQAVSLKYRLSEQRDWSEISANLDCINCQEKKCPINEDHPPCGFISPQTIVQSVRDKLGSIFNKTVSVVIPVYATAERSQKSIDRLNRCLEAILPQVNEVIISVDGPGPFTALIPDNRVKVVTHNSAIRRGFGKTCNWGVRQSSGQYVLLLNDDVYLNPGAVSKMMECMTEKVGVVGCLLWLPDGTIQHGGGKRSSGHIGWGHIDYRHDKPTIGEPTELEFVTYAAALIRRKAFFGVKGFDEDYDTYCEDGDMNLRLRQAGWKVIYTPLATGIHEESQTTSPMKAQLANEASQVFFKKWNWYFVKNRLNQMGAF